MKMQRKTPWSQAAVALSLIWIQAAIGQTFSSGSTGADGPLNVTTTQTIPAKPGGVYNHTTVNISSAGSLRYVRGTDNASVVILATGDVTISGTLIVSGNDGVNPGASTTAPLIGSLGGPGGFSGGNGGFGTGVLPTAGQGPGGGAPATTTIGAQGGTYGAPTSFVTLTPLFGGSGGGGGFGKQGGQQPDSGGSGPGGGGAILIASSTRIIINGQIRANGGNSGINTSGSASCVQFASPGSGGAIRLVAPEILGTGNVQAVRGGAPQGCSTAAGDGRIRFEANAPIGFTGTTSPIASVAAAPGPVSPGSNPALVNVPTLAITSIGGLAVPASPTASYFAPDLALAPGTANPVPVVLAATNTPVGSPTVINVRVMPAGAASSFIAAAADHTGTFSSSSATANVTLPVGQVSLIQASAAMTLTGQTASLFPLIDGEPVARVMVAAAPGQASTVSLVTRSGKEVRLDQLRLEEQVRVARAWETMKATQTE